MVNMRRKDEYLEMLFGNINIRLLLKAKRLEWAVHVWRATKSLTRNILTKIPPKNDWGRLRHRWLDRVKNILDVDNSKQLDDVIDQNG